MKFFYTFMTLLLLLIYPNFTFASGTAISSDGLTAPIETLFDVSLGMNLDEARRILKQEPYASKWVDRETNSAKTNNHFAFYDYKESIESKAFPQVKREFAINADRNNTINQITYVLYFRNEAEYNKLVTTLVERATAEWGTVQDEQSTGPENREALHRTWGKDNLHLTIVTRYYPEYNRQFPYSIRIARTKS